jgi:hypothetical protein
MTTRTSKTLRESTGRDYSEWFGLLDTWGAPGRPYHEIADWLTGEHGLSTWWAQKLIVEYEQDRGIRKPGARPDGSYSAGASKIIDGTPETILNAFTDGDLRLRWLPGESLAVRKINRARSAHFDWNGGPERIQVTVEVTRAGKTSLAVEHNRLSDADAAERRKTWWRDRLSDLKALVEA